MLECRAQVQQPARLFETAMRQVAGPPQPNRPSVFDRLTIQAAKGNNAAAVTASAVVRQLRRTAAAAVVSSEGDLRFCAVCWHICPVVVVVQVACAAAIAVCCCRADAWPNVWSIGSTGRWCGQQSLGCPVYCTASHALCNICMTACLYCAGQDSSSILALKQQLTAMEQEVTKLRRQQQAVLSNVVSLPSAAAVATTAGLGDCNSVVVNNVHFSATPEILAAHFSG